MKMIENHSFLLLIEIAIAFYLILVLFFVNHPLTLRNFYLDPFLYLFHGCQSVQFLIAPIGVYHSFDLLHPSQDLE